MNQKLKLDVCLSPKLIYNYDLNDTLIIVIDIVRASSSICTALFYGVDHIVALDDIEATKKLKDEGYVIAGERDGDNLEGFDYGNSPVSLMDRKLEGKKLAITTTNGTQTVQTAIDASKDFTGVEIAIGAFLNYSKLLNYIKICNKNVLLVCSGWKGNPSIEDTVFAGKLVSVLDSINRHSYISDSAIHAMLIYDLAGRDLFSFILDHSNRFGVKIGQLGTDIRYCLKEDVAGVLPMLQDGKFINKNI
jgi:2-phosphosulfolactate phosphatase